MLNELESKHGILAATAALERTVLGSTKLSQHEKKALLKDLNHLRKDIPVGNCATPEVILFVHMMKDCYLDLTMKLMNRFSSIQLA
jgi:hypothetical protein